MARITVHPGGFVKRNYVEALGLDEKALAEALEISGATLNRLLEERADLSPQLAIKLSRVLGRSPESWMNMQTLHTLAQCQQEMAHWVPPRTLGAERRISGSP